jgi:hypothetical protein
MAKRRDCDSYNQITGTPCTSKATAHIVEPGTLRMRHLCRPHAYRYLHQLEDTARWKAAREATVEA